LAFGFWLLAFGFWLLAFGFWLLAFGFWLLAFGFWLFDEGESWQALRIAPHGQRSYVERATGVSRLLGGKLHLT
jgi:hypothetical protein